MDTRPIGIFDSGIGGLSILSAIQSRLPSERFLYLADQVHVPYGPRPVADIREFSSGITRFLLQQDAKMIVVACNTASGAALDFLRRSFRSTPIIGLEPAITPAARITRSGKIAVLATKATLNARLYLSTRNLLSSKVDIFEATLSGIVEEIEANRIHEEKTRTILLDHIPGLVQKDVDTIVLGCSHYPFVAAMIQEIAGAGVQLINPAHQVAAHIAHTLEEKRILAPSSSQNTPAALFSTGDASLLAEMADSLAGIKGEPTALHWHLGELEKKE